MPGSFKIEELHSDLQRVIRDRQIDTGPNGAPDGRITEVDLPRIDALIAELDQAGDPRSKADAALLRTLRPATSDGLAVPRPAAAGLRVRQAIESRPRPGDAIQALTTAELRVATVAERVEMISDIIHRVGHDGMWGWWTGRVNTPREQRILEILNTTPDHQRGKLIAALNAAPNLIADMESHIDGDESAQFRAFLTENMWDVESPSASANILRQRGIHSEADLVTVARRLRERRGDAFANDVLSQLVAMQEIQNLLPYVYWTPPAPDCSSGDAALAQVSYQAMLEASRQINATRFGQLMSAFPPGSAATMLRGEFEQHNNIARVLAGTNIAVCVAQVLQRRARAAAEREAEAQRAADRERRRELEAEQERESRRAAPRGNPLPGTNSLPGGSPTRRAPPAADPQPTRRDEPRQAPRDLAAPSGRQGAAIATDRQTRAVAPTPAPAPAPERVRTPPASLAAPSGRSTTSTISTGSSSSRDKKK